MKYALALVVTLLPLPLMAQAKPPSHAKASTRANAALTGSYRRGEYGAIDVKALRGNRVRFQLTALAHINAPSGPNLGMAEGTLTLRNGKGVYEAEKPQTGRLLMTFSPKQVTITQKGTDSDMGFGNGVYATGAYKKVSSKTPKFAPMP